MFLPSSPRIRPAAAATTLLLALCLIAAGCSNPRAPSTPPLDAYALSGGKIKHFMPTPGLPNSPADKAMLLACRQLPITSDTARSAVLVVAAGQFGRCPLHALVIGKGNMVLMLPGDLVTMGMSHGLTFDKATAPDKGVGNITLFPGSSVALVGQKKILLHNPVMPVATYDLVMNWTDMRGLLDERDRQRHQPPFIRSEQIIYDIRDYHR